MCMSTQVIKSQLPVTLTNRNTNREQFTEHAEKQHYQKLFQLDLTNLSYYIKQAINEKRKLRRICQKKDQA